MGPPVWRWPPRDRRRSAEGPRPAAGRCNGAGIGHRASGPGRQGGESCRETETHRWRRDSSSPLLFALGRGRHSTDQRTVDDTWGTRSFAYGHRAPGIWGCRGWRKTGEARARKRGQPGARPMVTADSALMLTKGPPQVLGWDLGHWRGRQRTVEQAHQQIGALEHPGLPGQLRRPTLGIGIGRGSGANARLAGGGGPPPPPPHGALQG